MRKLIVLLLLPLLALACGAKPPKYTDQELACQNAARANRASEEAACIASMKLGGAPCDFAALDHKHCLALALCVDGATGAEAEESCK